MGLVFEIEAPVSRPFRRAAIQRRSKTTGTFDGVWQDITQYVKRWGILKNELDDVQLNNFKQGGLSLIVDNNGGAFNPETYSHSLWNGYLSRYRTIVRVEAGYYDSSTYSELPATATVGYFLADQEIGIRSDSNDVTFRCSSLQSLFDDVRSVDIAGLNSSTMTAGQIFSIIRNHTDGSGNFIFRPFITSTAWTIDSTTTNQYYLQTDTNLGEFSAWDLMSKLAEAEGYVVMINRQGGIEFRSRQPRQGTTQFSFKGQGFPRPTIISLTDYKEAYNKYYNYFRLKYLEADTSTSFVTAGTATAVNATNPSWLFGQRVYDFENKFIANTTTAQTIVNSLFASLGTMTSELEMDTVYHPTLEVLDRIDVSYHSYDLANSTIWDTFDWAPDTGNTGAKWSAEGENFDWDSRAFVIISRQIDLDSMKCTYRCRDLTQ